MNSGTLKSAPFFIPRIQRGGPEMVKTAICVEGGLVHSVYSTLPEGEHEIELLDMDNAKAESPEAADEMEARLAELSKSSEFHAIF